jgi:cell division protein FtsL
MTLRHLNILEMDEIKRYFDKLARENKELIIALVCAVILLILTIIWFKDLVS